MTEGLDLDDDEIAAAEKLFDDDSDPQARFAVDSAEDFQDVEESPAEEPEGDAKKCGCKDCAKCKAAEDQEPEASGGA